MSSLVFWKLLILLIKVYIVLRTDLLWCYYKKKERLLYDNESSGQQVIDIIHVSGFHLFQHLLYFNEKIYFNPHITLYYVLVVFFIMDTIKSWEDRVVWQPHTGISLGGKEWWRDGRTFRLPDLSLINFGRNRKAFTRFY